MEQNQSLVCGRVFNLQRFSTFDGPGVRTVVFLKGCPLRCLWCHNPEGLSPSPQLLTVPDRCIGCKSCLAVCPTHARYEENGVLHYDRALCRHCGVCAEVCFSDALQLAGKEMTPEQVLQTVLRDRAYYGTEGGITVSGGEPLMQWAFSAALLRASHEAGITTCTETSAFAPASHFRAVIAHTDTLLLDCKATTEEDHLALTGGSREPILANMRLADRMGIPTVLRCPVVPGGNDTDAHWERVGDMARQFDCITQIHLEPYHNIGLSKGRQIGYSQSAFDVPTPRRLQQILSLLQAHTTKTVKIS